MLASTFIKKQIRAQFESAMKLVVFAVTTAMETGDRDLGHRFYRDLNEQCSHLEREFNFHKKV